MALSFPDYFALVPPLALLDGGVGPAGSAALAAHCEESVGGRADADPACGVGTADGYSSTRSSGEASLDERLRRLQKHSRICEYQRRGPLPDAVARRRFPRGPRGDPHGARKGKHRQPVTTASTRDALGPPRAAALERARGAANGGGGRRVRAGRELSLTCCLGTRGPRRTSSPRPGPLREAQGRCEAGPDAGGGEAIPDVCGFDATIAWDADPTWWTWRQVLAILALVGLWRRASPGAAAYRSLRKLGLRPAPENSELGGGRKRPWPLLVLRRLVSWSGLCLRRPALLFVTVVPVVLAVTLSGQLGKAPRRFFFLFFGGLLIVFREKVRARYEKFCERRPWFGRHVAQFWRSSPCVEKFRPAAAVAWPFRKGAAAARSRLARLLRLLRLLA